jgi:hypothetical protein
LVIYDCDLGSSTDDLFALARLCCYVDEDRCTLLGVKSKVWSRVVHVFEFMDQIMGGLMFRGVGMARAKANIKLTNFVYIIVPTSAYLVIPPLPQHTIEWISNNYHAQQKNDK